MNDPVNDFDPSLLDLSPPECGAATFVAPGAVLVGQVRLAAGVSVWFGAVLRGDVAPIEVGPDSNIQDGAVLHGDPGCPVIVGARVTVGHRAVLHGVTVEDTCLIGMGAVVLNGATIGSGSVVAAGAVVTRPVAPRTLVAGVPARPVRQLGEDTVAERIAHALAYRQLAERYRAGR